MYFRRPYVWDFFEIDGEKDDWVEERNEHGVPIFRNKINYLIWRNKVDYWNLRRNSRYEFVFGILGEVVDFDVADEYYEEAIKIIKPEEGYKNFALTIRKLYIERKGVSRGGSDVIIE